MQITYFAEAKDLVKHDFFMKLIHTKFDNVISS